MGNLIASKRIRAGLAGTLATASSALALALPSGAGAGAVESNVAATPFGGSFDAPVHVTGASGFPDLVYVTQRGGQVRVVENGVQLEKPLIDVSKIIEAGGEQGLLSTAFPPDFAESGRFYLYFTNRRCNEETDGCDIEIAEFKLREDNPRRARLDSRRTVITIRHRDAGNHNGGTLAFGPDGKLWIATGDGGDGDDAFDNSSRVGKLLGKLLRINPEKPSGRCEDTGGGPARACAPQLGYKIPRGNPFVGRAGRDEIWSIGLRNPFRFSFDGDNIAIGDVGQGAREEVDIVPIATAKGADFQWPAREGTVEGPHPERATSLPQIPPIYDYPRPVTPPDGTLRGVTVIGGVVVRDPRLAGTAFDPANGRYLFAEAFSDPNSRSFVPNVGAQTISGLTSHPFGIDNVAGVSEDAQERVYVSSLNGTVHRIDPVSVRRQGQPIGDGEGPVDLEQVGDTFNAPVNSAFAPAETDKVYVVEQGGLAKVVVNGTTQAQPFLDITDRTNNSGEQGFLGMAFHPQFELNGLVYVYYTDEDNGDIVVDEFETNSATDADESSRREVIRIRHRFASNHNGGQVVFGPDGYMYLATGDGGSGDDPRESAQDKESLLGKLIRIDPLQSGDDAYTVPSDNPFVGRKGDDEIYALGLRNPFRFSFEPETGNIMIGDVGQNRFEEVDIESEDSLRKANFGWDRWEGFKRSNAGDTASKPAREDHDKPVLAYDHGEGASVIGGVVVRDASLANLYGRYLFTDFYTDRLRSFVPQLTKVDGYVEADTPVEGIASITEDPVSREVYITSRSDGSLYRLEPAP